MTAIPSQMEIYIPELRRVLRNHAEYLHRKLPPGSSDGILVVKECETLYIFSAQVGAAYFDSITVDYANNLITFHQKDQCRKVMGESVLNALQEFGIREFLPHRLAYSVGPPNRDPSN